MIIVVYNTQRWKKKSFSSSSRSKRYIPCCLVPFSGVCIQFFEHKFGLVLMFLWFFSLFNGLVHVITDDFTMSWEQRRVFLNTLKNVKMLDGYSSMISCCIDYENSKIIGLCDYCDILMQYLLSMVIHNVLLDHVIALSVEFCSWNIYVIKDRMS